MAPGLPFIGSIKKVEREWLDYNGHINMAYYSVLFDQTSDEAFSLFGFGPQYVASGYSFFTLEAHLTYVRELNCNDQARITFQLLDYDAKRMHYVQEMFQADDRWLSATMESVCIHVDLGARKSVAMPDWMQRQIADLSVAHKRIPIPQQVGHRIGIHKRSMGENKLTSREQ